MNTDQQHTNPKQHSSTRNRWQWALLLLIIGTLGYFWLNPPGVITPRVAEKYLGDPSTIKLSEYSSITVEAAQALAQLAGNLDFNPRALPTDIVEILDRTGGTP